VDICTIKGLLLMVVSCGEEEKGWHEGWFYG
jgi:hypothetical protein